MRPIPKYSGRASRWFWNRVNALTGDAHDKMYRAGVVLQNHENRVLAELEACEAARASTPVPAERSE